MEVGKRYLIGDSSSIREWEVLETAVNAVKVQDKIHVVHSGFILIGSSVHIDRPFWVLKSDIDNLGNTKYRILEELK